MAQFIDGIYTKADLVDVIVAIYGFHLSAFSISTIPMSLHLCLFI